MINGIDDLPTSEQAQFNDWIDAERFYPTPTDSCDICQGTDWVTVYEECIIPGGALSEEEARCECNQVDDYIPF